MINDIQMCNVGKVPWIHVNPRPDDSDVLVWSHQIRGKPLSAGDEVKSSHHVTFLIDVSFFDPRLGDLTMLRAMADWDTEWKPTIMSYINKTPSMNPDMRDSFMSSMNSFDPRKISMHSDLTVAPCTAIAHGTGEAKDSFETSCRR